MALNFTLHLALKQSVERSPLFRRPMRPSGLFWGRVGRIGGAIGGYWGLSGSLGLHGSPSERAPINPVTKVSYAKRCGSDSYLVRFWCCGERSSTFVLAQTST